MLTLSIPKPPCHPDDLRAGNIDALTCYCYRYLNPLTRLAAWIIKNEFAAPDLATANLEQLWHKRQEMKDEKAVRHFLSTNMRIICNQWLYEQLIIKGYLDKPPDWYPKYSRVRKI
ncbi:MAG: hypothetical protein H0V30_08305 [Chitinophagaceae bacterium]|nr:hypothetical protein [Chitinophagaceae bacterium]